jgi:hypothetical protein
LACKRVGICTGHACNKHYPKGEQYWRNFFHDSSPVFPFAFTFAGIGVVPASYIKGDPNADLKFP